MRVLEPFENVAEGCCGELAGHRHRPKCIEQGASRGMKADTCGRMPGEYRDMKRIRSLRLR